MVLGFNKLLCIKHGPLRNFQRLGGVDSDVEAFHFLGKLLSEKWMMGGLVKWALRRGDIRKSTRFADFLGVEHGPFGGFLDEVGGDAFGEVEDFV